ncbi:MAG: CDP-alcohol phosphatidyltransferase family protein [Solirubrobacteraceae bacterium]
MTTTAGERWTRTELARLRDAAWSPAAVLSFLGAAQARANLTRRARPALARQAAAWMLAGGVAWALVPGRDRAQGLWWWGGCALMLDWHLGMLETPDGDPVALGLPDALTLLRAGLVPAVAASPRPGLLLIGAATDLADGAVARWTRCTRFGRDLEGLVDACFTTAALRAATRSGGVSPLPAALEQARLVAGAAYASTVYFGAGHAPDPALGNRGRHTTPLRTAATLAAALGHRRLANGLLLTGSTLAVAAVLGHGR